MRSRIATDHHGGAGRHNIAVFRQESCEHREVVTAPVARYEPTSIEQVTRVENPGRVLQRIRDLHNSIDEGKGSDAMKLLMDSVEQSESEGSEFGRRPGDIAEHDEIRSGSMSLS